MSIFSSKSNRDREGFIPYQSEKSDYSNELSIFSRLNLNDGNLQDSNHNQSYVINNQSFDYLSTGSKKRKLSQQILKSSKQGDKSYLNRSIVGKSSLNNDCFANELDSHNSHHDRSLFDYSQNSCPVIIKKKQHELSQSLKQQIQTKRFTKTKNLLRNISSYLHKFILYNNKSAILINNFLRKKYQSQNNMRKYSQISQQKQIQKQSIESNQFIVVKQQLKEDSLSLGQIKQEQKKLNSQNQEIKNVQNVQMEEQTEQQYIKRQKKLFIQWISALNLANFPQYQQIWMKKQNFRGLYRYLCYKYYKKQAVCDIYHSRLTTKQISVSLMYQFIEGLITPNNFNRFK